MLEMYPPFLPLHDTILVILQSDEFPYFIMRFGAPHGTLVVIKTF